MHLYLGNDFINSGIEFVFVLVDDGVQLMHVLLVLLIEEGLLH